MDTLVSLLETPGLLGSIGTPFAAMALGPGRLQRRADGWIGLANETDRLWLDPQARLLAFETISADPSSWTQGLCLLASRPAALPRAALAWEGDALDLGLGRGMIRTSFRPSPESAAKTAALQGQAWENAAPSLAETPGTWVIETQVAVLERRPLGPPPPLFVLMPGPRAVTHPKTTPVPPGWFPALHLFPPHPMREGAAGFDPARHDAFQSLMVAHGRKDLTRLKRRALAALAAGAPPLPEETGHRLATIRVALRQWRAQGHTLPPAWAARFDPALARVDRGDPAA